VDRPRTGHPSSPDAPDVETVEVKGLDKLTTIRLAEILTQKNAVSNDVLTEALYSHDRYGESFVDLLIQGGHMSEWDLAKLVVEHFQLPFLLAGNYEVVDDVKALLPKEELFRHLIVPLDVFDKIVTVAMPILTPAETLLRLRRETGYDLYPYVGLITENRRVLSEMFEDFQAFQDNLTKERQANASKRQDQPGNDADGGDWMSIFDSGDAQVRSSLKK
jgi:hypothetical protein